MTRGIPARFGGRVDNRDADQFSIRSAVDGDHEYGYDHGVSCRNPTGGRRAKSELAFQ